MSLAVLTAGVTLQTQVLKMDDVSMEQFQVEHISSSRWIHSQSVTYSMRIQKGMNEPTKYNANIYIHILHIDAEFLCNVDMAIIRKMFKEFYFCFFAE